jgi:phage tail sheath gpL-like
MALTDIGFQKTPARPTEITFAAQLGLPSANQTIAMIGHLAVSGNLIAPYQVYTFSNVADPVAASGEATTQFGLNSEIGLMVVAAINANAGASTFPQIVCVPLAYSDTDWGGGASIYSLNALNKTECEFIVSPYDGQNQPLTQLLINQAKLFSGATRVSNGQYGTFGVVFNRSTSDPATLFKYDTQYLQANWLRDTTPASGNGIPASAGGFTGAPYSVALMAAACAGVIAANQVPFNPLDNAVLNNVVQPSNPADWISVGGGLESEIALNQGWTPLRVLPNLTVAFVRTVTARVTTGDGVTAVTAYYDVQDFQVLYFFRKTIVTRFNQPDFTSTKASLQTGQNIKSETIRLAQLFEDQNMFQAVAKLAPQFVVQGNASDRSRFDVFIPVNVIPGLHVIATNIQAGTQFDVVTV